MSDSHRELNEKEIRDRLKIAHASLKRQLGEISIDIASLMMGFKKSIEHPVVHPSAKIGANTALNERLTEVTALIEFIESLKLEGDAGRAGSVKEELRRRHAALAKTIESLTTDISGRLLKLQQGCLYARDHGGIIPFGEQVRRKNASDHARFMKDLAILGFIQSFGITSRSTRRQDL